MQTRANLRSLPLLRPEAILVDSERTNLRFQRRPRYAQLGRRAVGSEYSAAAFFECSLYHLLFLREKSARELNFFPRFRGKRLLWQPAFVDRKSFRVAKDYGSLDDVLQFAYVS